MSLGQISHVKNQDFFFDTLYELILFPILFYWKAPQLQAGAFELLSAFLWETEEPLASPVISSAILPGEEGLGKIAFAPDPGHREVCGDEGGPRSVHGLGV